MITISLTGSVETRGFKEGEATKAILEKIIWGNALTQINCSNDKAFPKKMNNAYSESLKYEHHRIQTFSQGAVIEPEELFRIYSTELGEVFRFSPPATSLLIGLSYNCFDGGFPILCINLDAPFHLHPFITFKKIFLDEEYSRLEFSLITSPGAFFGINEAGLSAALGLKPFEGDGSGFVPLSTTVSEVLRKCKTVDSAVKLINNIPRGASGTIALADSNEIVFVELTPNSSAVRKEKDGIIVQTEHFLSKQLMGVDLPHLQTHSETSPPELLDKRIYDMSERRFEEATEIVNSKIRWDVGGITDAITSKEGLLYLTEGYYKTSISALMIPGQKVIYFKESKKGSFIRNVV
jgi:Acyl-coenzyme A:6-aminopenicillanic acid acyl-transferase